MNSDTGQMYFEQQEIQDARMRGEPLVELTRDNIDRVIQSARAKLPPDQPVVPLTRGQLRRRQRMGK